MRIAMVATCGCMASFLVSALAHAQESTTYEPGPDGVQYKVTRRVVQRSIPTTEYQTREQKVYRPQVTTDYQSYQQMYSVPVTEYRWVSRQHGWWNPLAKSYWTHNLEPFTRWETRPGTVQVPTARTDWVEETRTSQVPVTVYRTVPEEYTSRVAVSVSPSGTSVASRPTSQQLDSDPPRNASPFSRYDSTRR